MGIPEIKNFDYEKLNIGSQSYMMNEDKFGRMYFANSDGLVTYNGAQWNLYPLPNKTFVRSIWVSDDGKIYAGGQNEFGYFFPASDGTLTFHSLKNLLPVSERNFADVWNIVLYEKQIFIRCSEKIYVIAGNKTIGIFPAKSEWAFMTVVGDRLFAQEQKNGLYQWTDKGFVKISEQLNGKLITGMMRCNNSLLIATFKNGLYTLNAENKLQTFSVANNIIHSQIYTATALNNDEFALGTLFDGVFIINKTGETVKHFYGANGLSNNNIISLFCDRQHNLWIGLDRGISMIDNNDAVQKITPDPLTPSACYTAIVFDDKLFMGTPDGLYVAPLHNTENEDIGSDESSFQKINNSNGQVWDLNILDNKLFMAHHEGGFLIENNNALPLFDGIGSWLYRNEKNVSETQNKIVGTYHGLYKMTQQSKGFRLNKLPNTIDESLRFVETDSLNHCIWASHPYRGVYKIILSDNDSVLSSKLYTDKNGLPNNLDNYVYKINNRIIFCTVKGMYTYDHIKDRFIPDPTFKNIFDTMPIRTIATDDKNNLWFVSEKKLGVFYNGRIQYIPEAAGKMIKGFEFIYAHDQKNIFVGTTDGLLHINFLQYNNQYNTLNILINKTVANSGNKDSVLFNGFSISSENSAPHISPSFNSLHFEFSSTDYSRSEYINYAYQLKGFDKTWSDWSNKNEKDYTNLPSGKHVFLVKARDNFGKESSIATYTFFIKPHWYETFWAKILYVILLVCIVLLIRKYQLYKLRKQQLKHREEQRKLQYLHNLEREHNEREIINLQKENLEKEINYKNRELANTSMHLYKRGNLLSSLKDKITDAVKSAADEPSRKELMKILRMLSEEEKRESDWEQFAVHFDDVHNNFLTNLKKVYPELSQSDMKICAYIKMNLSSKEIAQLLNISLKGVEVARYRLRKKLNINSSSVSLYDALTENKN